MASRAGAGGCRARSRMTLSERTRTLSALGIVEVFAWGSTYYLLAVLAGPMAVDTGWGAGTITAGVSTGLLTSGLVARRIGRLIHDRGGRPVLVAGMALIATGLVLMGLAQSVAVYFVAWIVVGLGMGAGLYDAAFSTLGRIYGSDARSAITVLTLWGGFASTVCWPISAMLVEWLGWRGTCLAYAALHLGVTLPLCRFALPRTSPALAPAPPPVEDLGRSVANGAAGVRFWCLAVAGTTLAGLASIWSIHLVTILMAGGHGLAAAVGLGALIGPAQVGARVIEMLGRGRHHPIWTLWAATLLVLLGFLGLWADLPAAAALVAYGAGNGLWSIARGALPLAIFDVADYPRIIGRLAAPMLLTAAAAPLAGAWLIETVGPDGTLLALTIGAMVPCAAALVLSRHLGAVGRSVSGHP